MCICFGDGCVDLGIVGLLILQGSNRIFNSLRHGIYICLLCQLLSSYYRIDCSLPQRRSPCSCPCSNAFALAMAASTAAVICRAILNLRIIAQPAQTHRPANLPLCHLQNLLLPFQQLYLRLSVIPHAPKKQLVSAIELPPHRLPAKTPVPLSPGTAVPSVESVA